MATSRYLHTKVERNDDGNRVQSTTTYPKIELSDDDIYIYAREGDRLDLLAHRFYGDVSMWWIIAQANMLTDGKFSTEIGTRLRIPRNTSIVFNKLESLSRER